MKVIIFHFLCCCLPLTVQGQFQKAKLVHGENFFFSYISTLEASYYHKNRPEAYKKWITHYRDSLHKDDLKNFRIERGCWPKHIIPYAFYKNTFKILPGYKVYILENSQVVDSSMVEGFYRQTNEGWGTSNYIKISNYEDWIDFCVIIKDQMPAKEIFSDIHFEEIQAKNTKIMENQITPHNGSNGCSE